MSSDLISTFNPNSLIHDTFNTLHVKKGQAQHLTFLTTGLFKDKCKNWTSLNNDITHSVVSNLNVIELYQLRRISKNFRESCENFLRSILVQKFDDYNCSRASTVSLLTYVPYSERIPSIILKAFGRSLLEAPFLGVFKNHKNISHHNTPIAKGFGPDQNGDMKPFISFYIGKRDLTPFKANLPPSDEQSNPTPMSTPSLRFIFTEGMCGHTLYSSPQAEWEPFFPKPITGIFHDLVLITAGFGLRTINWNAASLSFISDVFDQKHPNFIPWTKPAGTQTV